MFLHDAHVDSQVTPTADGRLLQYTIYLTAKQSVSLELQKSYEDRTYIFKAADKPDFDKWMTALKHEIYGPAVVQE